MKYPLMIAALLLLTFSLPALAAIDQEKGYDECLGCHDGVGPMILKTPHGAPGRALCSDCHGVHQSEDPSTENIVSLKKDGPGTVFKTCAKCHTQFRQAQSSHSSEGRACLSCHDMWHSEKTVKERPIPAERLLRDKTQKLCEPCHQRPAADFMKPYHHQASHVANRCAACHDPHLSKNELRGRKIDRKCGQCHPDAAGPFAFVHIGGKGQGCLECHQPHGSPNPHLLNRSSVRFLCLSCHTNLPAFHNQANPKYQQCTSCHGAIHGSNVSGLFFE